MDLARQLFPTDGTALQLSRNADSLGTQIPFASDQMRTAARLLVWLRQASGSDNPAKLVLCDRVIEQVAGWAGVNKRDQFTTNFLRQAWIHSRIWHEIRSAYLMARGVAGRSGPLRLGIEIAEGRPDHAPNNYSPSFNLKAVLENLDELIATMDHRSATVAQMERVRDRLASQSAVASWLDDLEKTFDRERAALRRNRNALMHGGPLVPRSVDHSSGFAITLAFHAITPAIEMLLEDEDLVDGFIQRRTAYARSRTQLRQGVPASEALFWRS